MNTHYDKTTENKSNTVANNIGVQQSVEHEGTFQSEDTRPETIIQRKVQDTTNNSQQVNQFKKVKALANNSRQLKQLKAVQALANDHFSNATQFKTANRGATIQRQLSVTESKSSLSNDQGNSGEVTQLSIGYHLLPGGRCRAIPDR